MPNWQKELAKAYFSSSKRVLIFDYDGTLVRFFNKPELAKPSLKLKNKLRLLSDNKQNHVVIITGRSKKNIDEWFQDLPITLAVEHGGYIRQAGQKDWKSTVNTDNSWKPIIFDEFEKCTMQVKKSFIEHKNNSLVWHYRTADINHVQKHLKYLKKILHPIAKKFNLKIEQGNMILEARPNIINKGETALKYVKDADFILVIGDDTTDECMFAALQDAWTIKVGQCKTLARYNVQNVTEVQRLLNTLIKTNF